MGKSGKADNPTTGGTSTKSDREVLERAQPVSADVPDVTGADGGEKIEAVDLALHGDAVTHWQDEPRSERRVRRKRDGEIPPNGNEEE